jgi:hypothetical protein
MRIVLGALLIAALILTAFVPSGTCEAAWYSSYAYSKTITISGDLPPAPDAPTDLSASEDDDVVTMTWVLGDGADSTIIVRNLDHFPADETDGAIVYWGGLTTCNDTLDIEALDATMIYYRAWSQNAGGLSASYDETSVGGNEMSNAIILIPLLALFMGLTVWGDLKRNWLLIIVATFGWFLMAGWSMTTSETMWDAYFIVGVVSIMLSLVTMIWPLVYRPQELPKEDDETESDRAWGGKKNTAWGGKRRKPRGRYDEIP